MADPGERVVMQHSGIEGSAVVTRKQFDGVWKAKGWTLATDQDPDEVQQYNEALLAGLEDADQLKPKGRKAKEGGGANG